MTRWVYRIAPARADLAFTVTDEEASIFAERDGYLRALKRAGILILAGVTDPSRDEWAATIFSAPDEVTARAVMQTDPAVSSGIVTAELFPFTIAGGPTTPSG